MVLGKKFNSLGDVADWLNDIAGAGRHHSFYVVWSGFELTVEVIIKRRLRLSTFEASVVCGGSGFMNKVHTLYSLLSHDGDQAGIKAIKDTQKSAERNRVAHGFVLRDEVSRELHLISRQVKKNIP